MDHKPNLRIISAFLLLSEAESRELPCDKCKHKHYLHHNGLSSRATKPGCDVHECKCTGYEKPRKAERSAHEEPDGS